VNFVFSLYQNHNQIFTKGIALTGKKEFTSIVLRSANTVIQSPYVESHIK